MIGAIIRGMVHGMVETCASGCYVGVVGDEHEARRVVADVSDTVPAEDTLPVVARMVVEIRSDGTRTIARGALDDRVSGQRVAVELVPGSPWDMAKSIAKLLMATPSAARSAVRSALRGRRLRSRKLRGADDE